MRQAVPGDEAVVYSKYTKPVLFLNVRLQLRRVSPRGIGAAAAAVAMTKHSRPSGSARKKK
jgi:hypothetical protein